MHYITHLRHTIWLILLLAACRAQKDTDYTKLYQKAMARYDAKDYYEALQLFKEVMPLLKGKKEIISAQFCQAYAYFYEKSYKYSAPCFGEFYKTYPRLAQAEEALFMQGYSYYLERPDVRLDQEKTEKALKAFELYIAQYPTGRYHDQASQYSKKLYNRLAKKAYRNAKLYYSLGYYQAAVIAFDNFQKKYIESPYLEKIAYLKIKSQYELGLASQAQERLDNLRKLMAYYYDFLDHYPESRYLKEIENLYTLTTHQINQLLIKP
jgi:outer membrane protein assembly factor BamD